MSLRHPLLTAAALLMSSALLVGTAQAQGGPVTAKKELIQKVLQLQMGAIDAIARNLAEQSIAPIAQQVGAVLQTRVAPDQREAMARDIQADFKKYGDEVLPLLRERANKIAPAALSAVMEEKFSEDELKQIIAMLEAPIYRKYQSAGPELQKAVLDKLVADTRSSVEPKLMALQEAVGKRLGLTPVAASGAGPASGAARPKPAASAAKK